MQYGTSLPQGPTDTEEDLCVLLDLGAHGDLEMGDSSTRKTQSTEAQEWWHGCPTPFPPPIGAYMAQGRHCDYYVFVQPVSPSCSSRMPSTFLHAVACPRFGRATLVVAVSEERWGLERRKEDHLFGVYDVCGCSEDTQCLGWKWADAPGWTIVRMLLLGVVLGAWMTTLTTLTVLCLDPRVK
ncbi:hypothetical protein DFP72DRAFT_846404 [Ephemerocybe angulata]|uniref:Uncharacterized protein n=1 Tax=Ephemerocybe angulata TaxID=980116 RepID=A0A8H6I189_9AGAR|nr:hypothetical protein DFP72DRAFT_846404 [Tulosesus angulatus]